MLPRACSPYGQHLLLSDFLNQKSHKLQGAHSFSLKGGYLYVMAWGQWLMPYSSDFLLYSAMNNYMFAHSLEYCKSAKRLFFFISGPYQIRLSTVIKTYINDQAESGINTAGTITLVGGNEGVGCRVLKFPEGGSACQDTIE